jgi:hypothetical protein
MNYSLMCQLPSRLMFPLCYNFLNMVSDPISITREVQVPADEGGADTSPTPTTSLLAPTATALPGMETPSGTNGTASTFTNQTISTAQYNSIFVKYQGKAAQLTPLLGDHYDEWLPQMVLVVALLTLLGMWQRIARWFTSLPGMEGDSTVSTGGWTNAEVDEGKGIIAQARLAEERTRKFTTGVTLSAALGTTRPGSNIALNQRAGTTAAPREYAKNTKDLLARYRGEGGTSAVATAAPVPTAASSAVQAGGTRDAAPSAVAANTSATAGRWSVGSWFIPSADAAANTAHSRPPSASGNARPQRAARGGFLPLGADEGEGGSNL